MAKQRHRWLIWRRAASVALLYAFVLAGFVESIAGPSLSSLSGQTAFGDEELCLVEGSDAGAPSEHRHSSDCCLHGCRVVGLGSPLLAQPRLAEWKHRGGTVHRVNWLSGRDPPPARMAAAGPFGARGPPLS